MSFEFRDAKRQDIGLLILLAGGTGSGKTESAMRLATGLSGGNPFAVIDTENGRALHKADDYKFKHAPLDEPFTPERYIEAVKTADEQGFPVIVIDSGSHVYEGVGGVLEIQAEEFERMGRKESARMSSWIVPKQRHKRFVQQLLRSRAHVILCLRAEDKIEIVKEDGKTVVRPKESLIGERGWIPICEKRLPFEATISLLLLQDNPGVPIPVKLEQRHAPLISLSEPLSEETGQLLGEWARGGTLSEPERKSGADADEPSADVFSRNQSASSGSESEWADEHQIPVLLELAAKVSEQAHDKAMVAVMEERGKHDGRVRATWLARQVERAREKAGVAPEPEQSQFADLVPESVKAS